MPKINIYVENKLGYQIHHERVISEDEALLVIMEWESKGFTEISLPFKPELGGNHRFLAQSNEAS